MKSNLCTKLIGLPLKMDTSPGLIRNTIDMDAMTGVKSAIAEPDHIFIRSMTIYNLLSIILTDFIGKKMSFLMDPGLSNFGCQ